MEKTMLMDITISDEVEKVLCDLQQTVESGASVILSFPLPGRIMVLHARSQDREGMNDENSITPHARISSYAVVNANVDSPDILRGV